MHPFFIYLYFDKGYVMFGKEVVTKHDAELCGRRNTARLENSFPTHFRTGDATGMDLQIDNKIYNNLRRHAYSEEKRYLMYMYKC